MFCECHSTIILCSIFIIWCFLAHLLTHLPNPNSHTEHKLFGGNVFVFVSPIYPYESESSSVVSNSLQPHGPYSPWNSPGQNTGVGSRSVLQGSFPTQELNPGLPLFRQILYQLSYQGSQYISLYTKKNSYLIGTQVFTKRMNVIQYSQTRLSIYHPFPSS